MTGFEEYLAEVRGAMTGMEPAVRDDILRELRSHLADAAAANGGDTAQAIRAMGSPVQLGRGYRDLYGYSRASEALFVLVAIGLSALTAPVLQGTTSSSGIPYYIGNVLALPFLVLVILWLLWVSARAGALAGLYAGLGAFAGRMATALVLLYGPSGGIVTLDGLSVLILSSALLVLLGWLPGTAKKAWTGPRAEL